MAVSTLQQRHSTRVRHPTAAIVCSGLVTASAATAVAAGPDSHSVPPATPGGTSALRGTAKRWSVLLTAAAVATVTAVGGALVLPRSDALATASSRPLKATVAVPPARPTASVATQAPPAPAHETVDLFGDSLGYQAEPYLDTFFAETGNYTVSNNTFGGTATCDWLTKMATAAAGHPRAAVLVFSGNAFTPCMEGVAIRSARYYDLYTVDTEQAIGIFRAVGTHVFLVGTPIDPSSVAGWDRLDDIYRQLAQANPFAVTYVDAGAAVELPSGGFTWQLPCLSIEPSCGPNGTNIVRSPDGSHFCPDGTPATAGVIGPCDEYSSGAFRFALAVVSAVTQYQDRGLAPLVRTARVTSVSGQRAVGTTSVTAEPRSARQPVQRGQSQKAVSED
jgi:hypothetical protein